MHLATPLSGIRCAARQTTRKVLAHPRPVLLRARASSAPCSGCARASRHTLGPPTPARACPSPRKSPRLGHAAGRRKVRAAVCRARLRAGPALTAHNAVRSGALASLHSLGYARGVQRGCIRTSCAVALPAVGCPFPGLFRSPPPLAPSAPPRVHGPSHVTVVPAHHRSTTGASTGILASHVGQGRAGGASRSDPNP